MRFKAVTCANSSDIWFFFSSRCSGVWVGGSAKILKRCLFPFYRFHKNIANASASGSCIRLRVDFYTYSLSDRSRFMRYNMLLIQSYLLIGWPVSPISDTDHLETLVLWTVFCQSVASWACLPKISRSKLFSRESMYVSRSYKLLKTRSHRVWSFEFGFSYYPDFAIVCFSICTRSICMWLKNVFHMVHLFQNC